MVVNVDGRMNGKLDPYIAPCRRQVRQEQHENINAEI